MATRQSAGTRRAADRPSLREEQRRFTRQRLIDGALEVFAHRGYTASTIDEIADAAGTSRATFYSYFPSKLDLLRAMNEEFRPEVTAYYDALDEVLGEGTREALRDWIDRAIGWFEANRTFAHVLQEALYAESGAVDDLEEVRYIPDRMTVYLAGRAPGRLEAARFRIVLLVHQLQASVRVFETGQFDLSREEFVEEMTDIWQLGLDLR